MFTSTCAAATATTTKRPINTDGVFHLCAPLLFAPVPNFFSLDILGPVLGNSGVSDLIRRGSGWKRTLGGDFGQALENELHSEAFRLLF